MKASDTQVGGKHYKDMVIQPAEFCQRNRLNWCEANVVKYICRHADKKGAEDLQKAKHYIDLLLEWEYSPADTSNTTARDATAESLCLTCGRDPGCVGDYPRTKDGGCEGYTPCLRENMLDAKQEAAPTMCDTCTKERVCGFKHGSVSQCELYERFEGYAKAKQEAPIAAVLPLDFTLPSIALKCTAKEAMAKFESEIAEWRAAKKGSLHEIAERWDCLQALNTFAERGGDVVYYQDHVRTVMGDLAQYAAEGRDVMKAKRGVLFKNASRHNAEGGRGYYAPETCAAIIASKGHRFQPLDGMGVI